MSADFEKLYGEPVHHLETNVTTVAELEALILQERDVKCPEGEQLVLKDRKAGNFFVPDAEGKFVLSKKNDYVIFMKKPEEIQKLLAEQDLKEKEKAAHKAKEDSMSFTKRDVLRKIEQEVQQEWENNKVFQLDAPENKLEPKFMATFPYPYMNGRLHLGHSFTLSKAEFAVGYEKLKGKNALFPFGFHCTGMPIKACADKIKREMEDYGNPPQFPPQPDVVDIRIFLHEENRQKKKGEARSRKAKVASKTDSSVVYQWQIMKSSNVSESEIAQFSDARHWLYYFPPMAIEDMKTMGVKVDWRRTFITTDVNPYYDSFVRWQFERLKEQGKIKFGKRYTIYSEKDGGPCLDHDRQTGEGVLPQEYTLVKQEVLEPFPAVLEPLKALGKKIYLVPATLRPETMYGQTNCWVLPSGEYGAFEINDKEIYICTERAARNLAFQEFAPEFGKMKKLASFTGEKIIGAAIHAPLSQYEKIYVLPMFSISTAKTTGVVTSVPSDSPDDFAAYRDVRSKADVQKKFGITPEMVAFEPIPIITVPGYGEKIAEKLVLELGIKSQNDRVLLDKAKETAYQKGFYEGTMTVGKFAGMSVQDAKNSIRQELIDQNLALPYSEPQEKVTSRSGDECVVALVDQWYLDYGEEHWRKLGEKALAQMECFSEETRHKFLAAFEWMKNWACSRLYGLGTKLPWDPVYLIESLSDSTIYMAYYTIAHILQHGSLDGEAATNAIKPEWMTNEVYDYVFLGKDFPAGHVCQIPQATLAKMCEEFNYWYPVDLRVSGKDLVPNHLLFFIYNHVAMFPEKHWPKGVRANGHVLLNGNKMSKSTGNFVTLKDAVERYSADGMRFALADAGDTQEDANFTSETADNAVLKLYTQLEWFQEVLQDKSLREGAPTTFADRTFLNEMRLLVKEADTAYSKMNYKEALKAGFFDLQLARDTYRVACQGQEQPMNRELIQTFITAQTLVLTPVCPHWSEHVWRKVLGNQTSVMQARWPQLGEPDMVVLKQREYLLHAVQLIRDKKAQLARAAAKKKGDPAPKPTKVVLFVAKRYPVWQEQSIRLVADLFHANGDKTPDRNAVVEAVRKDPIVQPEMKKAMPFVSGVLEDVAVRGKDALILQMAFDEHAVLAENEGFISKAVELAFEVYDVDDAAQNARNKSQAAAVPGKPAVNFE